MPPHQAYIKKLVIIYSCGHKHKELEEDPRRTRVNHEAFCYRCKLMRKVKSRTWHKTVRNPSRR